MQDAHSVDVLQDHLVRARASGGVFARSTALPPWGLRLEGSIQLAVHAVVQGRAWLWLDDPRAAIEMAPGDVVLVRGGPDHHIAHHPSATCLGPADFRARHAGDEHTLDGRASVFLCGAYRFSGDVGRGLLEALPQTLPLSATADDPLHDVIALLSRELAGPAQGQQTILDRLLDVLLVLAIRASFRQSATAPRWYLAAAEATLGPALHAIHADAAHPWTVPELAATSGLSRAAFARRFRQALGLAPAQYLADWRMTLARDYLRTGDLTLAQIADRTGYASPYAFAAAFRRHHGVPPRRWRHQQTAPPDDVTDARTRRSAAPATTTGVHDALASMTQYTVFHPGRGT
jgi:AraC-like DNA-binding protein